MALWRLRVRALLAAGVLLAAMHMTSSWSADEGTSFQGENELAMNRMMAAMHVAPSGDADHDFAVMMIAHHQGAIEMARAQLRYGRNRQLLRLAQEIIVTQQQEIEAMRMAIAQDDVVGGAR
jgi:uncharacterized protein (DUF305 family)